LETGVGNVAELAERRHNRLVTFLHDEEPAAQPDKRHHAGNQPSADAGALHVGLEMASRRQGSVATSGAAALAEQPAELAIEIAPQLVEVGRAVVAPVVAIERPSASAPTRAQAASKRQAGRASSAQAAGYRGEVVESVILMPMSGS
jgi:hypothetical protein